MALVVNATRRYKNSKRAAANGDETRLIALVHPDNLLDVEGFPATIGEFWTMDDGDLRQLATNLGMKSEDVVYTKLMHEVYERIAGTSY
ncbi:hypothetical protein CNYM01_13607 [Colletotrichum nymphaeae SA-01]|uniref:Uncharacterized protein n=1 Tax=Colletotrichum nymphaeae SA-01 TaxID=1460502 RepID=A0A135UJX0_9PEZI|nr:hypothetical protein CNYM01_13607 [Colletotrichum nymphaeae SA-01]